MALLGIALDAFALKLTVFLAFAAVLAVYLLISAVWGFICWLETR